MPTISGFEIDKTVVSVGGGGGGEGEVMMGELTPFKMTVEC